MENEVYPITLRYFDEKDQEIRVLPVIETTRKGLDDIYSTIYQQFQDKRISPEELARLETNLREHGFDKRGYFERIHPKGQLGLARDIMRNLLEDKDE